MRHLLLTFLSLGLGCAMAAELIVHNARVTTLDPENPAATAVAVKDGKFLAVGGDSEITALRNESTRVIDAKGRRLIPGLNDSHLHVVRGSRFYNLELHWEGVESLAEALDLVKRQARRTPKGHWVRVIGGWSPFQFQEKRMPTVAELNAAAPDTPVFVLFLYSSGLLNRAGMRALGIDGETTAPPGSRYERDEKGQPTGLLIADPNPAILYQTIAALPHMTLEQQINSSRQFYRRLNALGVTSAVDAGGGGHAFPENYAPTLKLAERDLLPMRVSAYLFPQKPNREFETFQDWMGTYRQGQNLDRFRGDGYVIEGGGELLVWSASDYENFLSPRPDLKQEAEAQLEQVVRLHLKKGWPFRIHATYDESIGRMLDVLEKVNLQQPLNRIRWAFDHAETVSEQNLERIKALGGGIAIQSRMAFAGEFFLKRYGKAKANQAPPIRRMLEMGIPVGGGTDGTRVSSFNPWIGLYWLVSGKSVGGAVLKTGSERLTREEALNIYTHGSAWFSGEENVKGLIKPGYYADFSLLNADYFTVREEELKSLQADLTVVNGRIEYASPALGIPAPTLPAPIPSWSPANLASASNP